MVEQMTEVTIKLNGAKLSGSLETPSDAVGIVVFAHGSGSSRHSPRNNFVAQELRKARLATLLFDLLTEKEDEVYETRFDIGLLTKRLVAVTRWLATQNITLPIGYFGASTGAAAALDAAAELDDKVKAVVSRGGRPDLATRLERVTAATLLIVGEEDKAVIGMNKEAKRRLHCKNKIEIVPGATHLFEEPGTLETVAKIAAGWFTTHLK